jgi:hypothetical protein
MKMLLTIIHPLLLIVASTAITTLYVIMHYIGIEEDADIEVEIP